MGKDKIDFVIIWVDGNDKEWQKTKAKYMPQDKQDAGMSRYRDWDNLKYWFRGVEKFAPWVNKIHFITCGQCPEWLNAKHPKLNMVNHTDYIPKQYLPTFSSHPIELNIHRIEGLSEQFVYFNDDIFITDYIKEEEFFQNGKPLDIFMEYPIGCSGHNEVFSHILVNNTNLMGKYYTRDQMKKNLKNKILTPKYGTYYFYNWLMYHLPFPNFFGLLTPHFALPHLKSSFEELWEREPEILEKTCSHRFRDKEDVNQYVFRMWNLLKGNFVPNNRYRIGKAYFIKDDSEQVYRDIESQKYKLICLNDDCGEEKFEIIKNKVINSFERILPEKSSYEK